MEIELILKMLMRRWYMILIPSVLIAVLVLPDLFRDSSATSGGFSTVMRYTAAQELEAIPNRDGDYQDVWLASELTVNAFTEWIRSSSFAQEVATAASGRGLTVESGALAFAADNERSIGQIFISWGNEGELRTIAESAIEVLQTKNQTFPQLGGVPADVQMLDDIRIAPAPPPLTNRFKPLLQLAIGVFIGLAAAVVAEYFDPTVHDRAEVEQTGVRVIASVPKR